MCDASQAAEPLRLEAPARRSAVDPRVTAQAKVDPRVTMVLAVLGGQSIDDVAEEWDVETSMVHRWVRDFLVAGTATITNRPDPDAARQRDRFLAAFAHELRTPLAVAQGWADILADGDVPEDQIAESVGRLYEALSRLAERALDVELMASASLGRVRISPEPVLLSELCSELAGCTGMRSGPDEVYADRQLFTRTIRDLWAAAHADPAPDSVHFEVADSGPWREVRVVRTGTPFGPSVLEALFDPFDHNDDTTGVTIGLYLARALTVVQGGHIGAEEDDDTTVLWVRLPRQPAGTDPEPRASGTTGVKGGK